MPTLLLCILYYVTGSLVSAHPVLLKYGVVMDAGSSGTRVYVYRWQSEVCSALPDIEKISSNKVKPGLSSLSNRLSDVPAYLDSLLDAAKSLVPAELRGQTEISLMATAGLRSFDGDMSEQLLDAVRDYLKDPENNPFVFNDHNVKVLSGELEGVYAWIAVNYRLGNFAESRIGDKMAGILEMGGGSTQIAFVPDVPIYAGLFRIELEQKMFEVYSHSYMSYGQAYMQRKMERHLYEAGGKSSLITDPCRLIGDEVQTLMDGEPVVIRGSSEPVKCLELLDFYVKRDDDEFCNPKPCAIGRVYQPPVGNNEFYAFSGFAYAPATLKTIDDHNRLNISKLFTRATRFCQMTVTEAAQETGGNPKYLSSDCLMGLYTPLLFSEAYGFPPETKHIKVTRKIGGKNVDWTVGAILDLNNLHGDCISNESRPIHFRITKK